MPLISHRTSRWIAVPVIFLSSTLFFFIVCGAILALPTILLQSSRSPSWIFFFGWVSLLPALGFSIWVTLLMLKDHKKQAADALVVHWVTHFAGPFGEFATHVSGAVWRTPGIRSGSHCLSLCGQASEPSEADFELWKRVEVRLDEIVEIACAHIVTKFPWADITSDVPFELNEIELFSEDNTFQLSFFLLPPHPGDLFPHTRMNTNLQIVASDCSP